MKKYYVIGGIILLIAIAVTIYFWPKKMGGGDVAVAQASLDAVVSKDPAKITSEDATAYVKALVEQKQAQEAQALAESEQWTQAQEAQRLADVALIKAAGFSGNASRNDFEKLIKMRPEYLGEFNEKKLDYYASGGLDGFIQMYKLYW